MEGGVERSESAERVRARRTTLDMGRGDNPCREWDHMGSCAFPTDLQVLDRWVNKEHEKDILSLQPLAT